MLDFEELEEITSRSESLAPEYVGVIDTKQNKRIGLMKTVCALYKFR